MKQPCQLWKQTTTCFIWQINTSSNIVGTGEHSLEKTVCPEKETKVKTSLLSSLLSSSVSKSVKVMNKNMCSASDAINECF